MITGDENILNIASTYPLLVGEFEKHGMGSYFKTENLNKIGRFTRLNTLLKSNKIDAEQFIEVLNRQIIQTRSTISSVDNQQQLHLMAMLPCGLRNPFKEFIESHIANNSEIYSELNYLIEGNVNHELSYYPLLDNIDSADELPDIIIASDINNFFHRPFIDRFLSKGIFETYTPYTPNVYLEKVNYADPANNYTMFTSNMLVMVVDKNKLGDRKMPESWNDLLLPHFENDIIMRGEDNFFCNAVMLPFYKDYGFDAIEILGKNVKSGKHPAEMVKLAESGKEEGATIYIMPYFFSKRIKSKTVEVVWPNDGAIASPVFMLVKKEYDKKYKPLLDFIVSAETGDMLVERHFPSINPMVDHTVFNPKVKWLGWDFLNQYDIGKLKSDIENVFMPIWRNRNQ